MADRFRTGAVLRRAGLHRLPRLGAGALRARRDHRLRLRPAPRRRADAAPRDPRRDARASSRTGPPRLGDDHVLELATLGAISETALTREAAVRHDGGRPAQHLRARAQPAVLHLRRRARLPARHPHARRRHVRDRLLRLSRLPQRHPAGARQGHLARHGHALRDRDAADVDRQGRHLGDGRALGGSALVDLIVEHTHTCYTADRTHPPRLGLRLRPMPRLRIARERRMGEHGRPSAKVAKS